MAVLEFGKRAERCHFGHNDNEWNLDLSFQLECKCVFEEIERVAGDNYREFGYEQALACADTIMDTIRKAYTAINKPPQPIWNKAVSGELERECPKKGAVLGFRIAFWFALLAEIVVMGVQAALSGDINPFIFVLAFILGLGGFFQGLGLGNLFFIRWKDRTGRPHSAPTTRDWVLLALGTVLILLVSTIRGVGGSGVIQFALVFFITFFFGEAVAICEASAVDLARQRTHCQEDMLNCQKLQASQNHSKNLDDGSYRKRYIISVENADKYKFQRNPTIHACGSVVEPAMS